MKRDQLEQAQREMRRRQRLKPYDAPRPIPVVNIEVAGQESVYMEVAELATMIDSSLDHARDLALLIPGTWDSSTGRKHRKLKIPRASVAKFIQARRLA